MKPAEWWIVASAIGDKRGERSEIIVNIGRIVPNFELTLNLMLSRF